MKHKNENSIFTGAATALITPLCENGPDYDSLGRLIEMQISGGIDALVICGTTGENATLTDLEKQKVIAYAVEKTNGRVPVIAGTGTNSTEHACRLTRDAVSVGCDAVLVVTPYYNKATQKGLVSHFFTIADASDKPMIVYNVPSRTGVGIAPRTYLELSEHPNVKAIKEANGDFSAIAMTASLVGDRLDLYSGNDDQIVPMLSLGGKGVISVLSNVLPGATSKICHDFFEGRIDSAREAQLRFMPLIRALFSQVNPIPVKAALSLMGYCENTLHLPLTPLEAPQMEVLRKCMQELHLI